MANPLLQLRFYKDETLNSKNADKLNELYNLFKDDNTKWISRQECLNLKSGENCIFVFCKFEGAAFEHVKNLNSRIVSAACMLHTFNKKKKLPRSIIPIYSSSMLDLNICCSNMEKKLREEIYSKVEMMRGKISKIFTENVTHLVTTEVGSAKYHAAGSMKLPIMLADWVIEVWNEAETEDVHATDAKFLKYKCPIFHKLIICASGFNEETKNKIRSIVDSEGGTYRGDLVCGTTTHLVLNEPKGTKYDHAKLWKINVVKSEWIYESIKAGYCLPEKDFILVSENQTSTPSESRILPSKTKKIPDIDLSVINHLNNTNANSTKFVNETENRTGLNQSTSMLLNNTAASTKNCTKPMSNYSDLVKELSSIGKIKLTLLDGIGIFCEITDPVVSEKIKKICNLGGAIRFDEYNSDVTHVIVNQVNEQKCKSYIELNPEINIVTIDWLIDSCKQNQLEDCKMYCVYKNALNSVKTPKKR
ncbi:DNA topoisomerase 2-binding 1 [Brachionus plicatilis]|uniref:DNA topoisomerase 2-binding 1 n=1 Tax=Brachionus plicatilis TaxID=10195 RepID=A0A3M7Q0W9_BRAPC|nr:DNA topoisomerase 2-binding 1 [Brachionus plicatilis]